MNKLLDILDKWKTHLKPADSAKSNAIDKTPEKKAEEKWAIEPYITQSEFYLTQSGQLIRQPVTRKKFYKVRQRRRRTKE